MVSGMRSARTFSAPDWGRFFLLVFCLLLGMSLALPASAQDMGLEDMLAGKHRKPVGGKGRPVVLTPDVNPVKMEIQWGLRRGANNEEGRDQILESQQKIARQLGIPNQPFRASSLLLEAEEALRKHQPQIAEKRLEQARAMAPDLPTVAFAQAEYRLRTSPFAVPQLLGDLTEGYQKSWSYLPARFATMTNLTVALLVGMALFALLVGLVVLLRHLDLLAADFSRVLPSGISARQRWILAFCVVVLPGLLVGSPILSLAVALVLLSAYMNWSERVAAALVLLCAASLPYVASFASAGAGFVGSEEHQLAEWGLAGCLDECQKTLSQKNPSADARVKHAELFLLATSTLRRGQRADFEGSIGRYNEITYGGASSKDMLFAAFNNAGVAHASLGNFKEAQSALNKAIIARPRSWGARLNLSRVQDLQGSTDTAQATLKQAVQLGGERAAKYSQMEERYVSTYFHLEPLPVEGLFEAHLGRATKQKGAVRPAVWRRVAGNVPLDSMPLMAGSALSLMMILLVLGRAANASARCPRCRGHMVKNGRGPHGEVQGQCRTCAECARGGPSMDYHSRVKHERAIDRRAAARVWGFRLGNLTFPGLGAAITGQGGGVWLFLMTCLGAAFLVLGEGPMPDTWRLQTLWNNGTGIFGAGTIALAFVLSLAMMVMSMRRRSAEEE